MVLGVVAPLAILGLTLPYVARVFVDISSRYGKASQCRLLWRSMRASASIARVERQATRATVNIDDRGRSTPHSARLRR